MDPDLFRDLIVSRRQPAGRLRRWVLPTSLVAHAAVVAALIVVPILVSEDFPVPSAGVRAFFGSPPALAAPPPPPPPAQTAESKTVNRPVPAESPRLTSPMEIPDDVPTPEVVDLGIEGGAAGGVKGGVAGGVVGGIVGGLVDGAPPRDVDRVVTSVTEPRKLHAVAPVYPEVARRAHVQGMVVLYCIVDQRGRVADVSVAASASELLNNAAVEAVRQWIYAPTLVDGVPVRLRVRVTVSFVLNDRAELHGQGLDLNACKRT